MFGLGVWEIVIIGGVAVLLFGAQLPKVAANLGRAIPSFKRGLQEVNEEIAAVESSVKDIEREIKS